MGADGGSIAKRSDLIVEETPVKQHVEGENSHKWNHCALTDDNLADPVVSDWNGNLYNKIAILRYLLGELPRPLHKPTFVSQIRDIVELKRELDEGGKWIDMISRKQFNEEGNSEEFAYIAECGHVIAQSALARTSCCPICEQSFSDTIILNPQTNTALQHNELRLRKLNKMGLSHSLRPAQKTAPKRRASENDNIQIRKKR